MGRIQKTSRWSADGCSHVIEEMAWQRKEWGIIQNYYVNVIETWPLGVANLTILILDISRFYWSKYSQWRNVENYKNMNHSRGFETFHGPFHNSMDCSRRDASDETALCGKMAEYCHPIGYSHVF